MSDEWEDKLLAAAKKRVGKNAVLKDKFGKDCFVLVDELLREIGAATAYDGSVKVTPTADYDWGDGVIDLSPGDILQFKKHVIHVDFEVFDENGKKIQTGDYDLFRGHHSAVVQSVNGDGSYTIIEQNVHPDPGIVHANTIPALDAGITKKTVKEGKNTKVMKITVTGDVKYYRPKEKPEKGASLLPTHAPPAGGWSVPAQGGTQRSPGLYG